jgi:hypothetical protein
MLVLKKIALKGILLIGLLVALNFIYKASFFKADLAEFSKVSIAINQSLDSEILYLGDCSDSYFGSDRTSEKGISQILDSLLTDQKVATISETGFNSEMYAAILNNLPEVSKIKTVIVTMNLRSFSSYTRYSNTYNSTNQRLILLDKKYPPILNRFFLSFKKKRVYNGTELQENKIIDYKKYMLKDAPYNTLYEWSNAFDNKEVSLFDYSLPIHTQDKAKGYITNYAFQINPKNNPILNGFDEIVEIAKAKNIKLVFHLLPENIKECNELIGADLVKITNKNRDLLIDRYSKNKVTIIDNLEILENQDYIENIPNSHYYYNGRKLMAMEIFKHFNKKDK